MPSLFLLEIRVTRGKAINLNRPFKWIQRKCNLQNSVGSTGVMASPQLRRRGSYRLDQTGIGKKKQNPVQVLTGERYSKLTLRMSNQTKRPPLKRRIADVSKILTTQQIKSNGLFSVAMEMNLLFIFTWRYPSENERHFTDGAGSARKFDSSKLELNYENSNLNTSVSFGSYEATRSTLRS